MTGTWAQSDTEDSTPPSAKTVIAADHVTQRFGAVIAVSDISFSVTQGEAFGIIGANGAGKTTLLNCLSRVHRNYGGSIAIRGQSTKGVPPHRLAAIGVARTFQGADTFDDFTVLEYVLTGRFTLHPKSLLLNSLSWPSVRRREVEEAELARASLAEAGLADIPHRRLGELSYGVRKLVDIIRATATGATILLLDEPTSGTATQDRELIADLLDRLRGQGLTVVLVDHDVSFVARQCGRLLTMSAGQQLALGPTAEVLEEPAVIRSFIGGNAAEADRREPPERHQRPTRSADAFEI